MMKWAAGLLCFAVGLAMLMITPWLAGQPALPAAPAAGSSPERSVSPLGVPALAAPPPIAPVVSPEALAAMPYAQRYTIQCAPCHGANGRMEVPLTPVLAGQPSLYVITQLFLFREGRRSHEPMTAVAKTLNDDDLQGFADFIGTLPPVTPPPVATPPDPIRMATGQALAEQHKCLFCHGPGLGGGQQVPLIGGQHEEYLQLTLRGFHDGSRPGYTLAMTAAMSQIPPEDLDPIAYFVARFRGPAEQVAGN